MTGNKPFVCFRSAVFREKKLEDVIDHLVKTGYDGIEIAPFHLKDKAAPELAAIRRLAAETGLRIAMLSPHFALTRDIPQRLEQSLATAGFAVVIANALAGSEGPPMIRVVTDSGAGSIGAGNASPEHWQRATHALRRITALDPGMVFALETAPDTLADQPDAALRLLDAVGARNLWLSYRPAEADPVAEWRTLRHAVRHVHLPGPDTFGGAGGRQSGAHRLSELIAALRSDGYAGSVSLGYQRTDKPWEEAATARGWLRNLGL